MVSVPASVAKDISSTVFNGYYSDDLIARVIGNSKARVISLPVLDTTATLPLTVANTQEMALADGKSREIGATLTMSPVLQGTDLISENLEFKNIRVTGSPIARGVHPIFSTQHITTALILFHDVRPGYYCLNLRGTQKSTTTTTYDANGRLMASIADANERQLLFVKITRG